MLLMVKYDFTTKVIAIGELGFIELDLVHAVEDQ
jgi:hypothetical protein